MIDVQALTKFYDSHPAAVDVTFRAEKGEILGFLGPNGAGKTTTMRMLTCFLTPTRGRASVAGYDILESPMKVRENIGYLPENVPLYPDLSVSAYLDFVGALKGMDKSTRRQRASVVMDDCGIADVSHRLIGNLSRGYRQRVGLAQALLNDPSVLILDEPTVGLDPRQIVEIRELIRNLAGRRTVILSTHILPEVSLLCQRVIIINRGRLVTDDTPANLQKGFGRSGSVEVTVAIDCHGDVAAILNAMPGVIDVEPAVSDHDSRFHVKTAEGSDIRADIATALVQNGVPLLGLRPLDLTLEDIFVKLVTEEAKNE